MRSGHEQVFLNAVKLPADLAMLQEISMDNTFSRSGQKF